MAIDPKLLTLYAVTDRPSLKGGTLEDAVEAALKGGVTLVQLREKDMAEDAFAVEAASVKTVCDRFLVPLIINDSLSVCLSCGAAGIHLGLDDMKIQEARRLLGPDKIIGATAHNLSEALAAEAAGADYLGIGAAFGSDTKKDASPFNIENYLEITSRVRIPVVAIGGITASNLPLLGGRGLSGAAVVSGLFASDDICLKAKELRRLAEAL